MVSLWIVAAIAQDVRTLSVDDFQIKTNGITATVTQAAIPRWSQVNAPDRTCRLRFFADAGSTEVRSEVDPACHPALMWTVEEAAVHWKLELDQGPARSRPLLEVWFVYPPRRGQVEVAVRQVWDAELRVIPEWLDVMEYELRAVGLPKYPAKAQSIDTDITICDVDLDFGASMSPTQVRVRRCDEVFHEAAEAYARKWLIRVPERENQVLWSGLTVGMQFFNGVGGSEGRIEFTLPPKPDMGGRASWVDERPFAMPDKRPAPETDPIMEVRYRGYRKVGVFDIVWPEPVESNRELRCDVLMLVNDERQVFAWPQGHCDAEVNDVVTRASRGWYLDPEVTILTGEESIVRTYPEAYAARFRGTFVFPPRGGHPRFEVKKTYLVSDQRSLPEFVDFVTEADPMSRPPPKIAWWRDVDLQGEIASCTIEVDIRRNGSAGDTRLVRCPPALYPVATKAVRRWRWSPASANGAPIPSRTQVTFRFDPRAQSR